MLFGGRWNAILRKELADRAVLAFGRGTVVAPDVEDQRVLAIAESVDLVDDSADLCVHMLREAGKHLHQAALERPLVLGD